MQRLNVLMWRRELRWVLSPGNNPLSSPSLSGFKEGVRDITQKTIFSISNRECAYCLCWVLQCGGGEKCWFGLGFKTQERLAHLSPGLLLGEPPDPTVCPPPRPHFACQAARRASFCLPVLLSVAKQLGVRVLSLSEGFSLQDRLRGGCRNRRVMLEGGCLADKGVCRQRDAAVLVKGCPSIVRKTPGKGWTEGDIGAAVPQQHPHSKQMPGWGGIAPKPVARHQSPGRRWGLAHGVWKDLLWLFVSCSFSFLFVEPSLSLLRSGCSLCTIVAE